MSNASSVRAFAGKFEKAASTLPRAQLVAVTKCAEATKVAFVSAPGAPHTVAGKSASVGYTVKDSPIGAEAVVRWRGPVHLVNNPTVPHVVEQRDFVGPITIPGVGFRMYAHHPGTRGKHFFEHGREAAEQIVPGIYGREFRGSLARTFSG